MHFFGPLGRILSVAILLLAMAGSPAQAATSLVPAFADLQPHGPATAEGMVIWSHGRSLTREDSESATPPYLRSFAEAGWDVLRFNRPRAEDILETSATDLAARVHALKQAGYRKIVLAGQSYGGFIALEAAHGNDDVHAVLATAPAAYGNFFDSYTSWRANADAFYQLLQGLGHTRVLLAFFHGDDYDPGGRGIESERILDGKGLPHMVIDQPRDLVGHLAANSGLFVRRYAACLVSFAAAETAPTTPCDASWGSRPSAALVPPHEAVPVSTSTGASDAAREAPTGRWYGYYPNGREFMLDIRTTTKTTISALYGIGPSIDGTAPAAWIPRQGKETRGALVFAEHGKSRITFAPTELGTMNLTWIAADGSTRLEATARRID